MTTEVRIKIGDFSHIVQEIPILDAEGNVRPPEQVTVELLAAAGSLIAAYGVAPEPEAPTPAPQQQTGAAAPQQPQKQAPQGDQRLSHSWGLCPQCQQPSKPSIAQYQQWEDDEEGNQVPAKHFCPNNQCQTKSLWRRELLQPDAAPF